jgi:acyl-CoA thioesterase FadM
MPRGLIPGPRRQPLVMYQGQVLPGWIDYNGHMTESRYYFANSETVDNFLRLIGAGMDYVAAGHSYYSAETHIRHLGEAKLGDRLRGDGSDHLADEKRFRSFVRIMKGERRRDGRTAVPACRHEGGQDRAGLGRGLGKAAGRGRGPCRAAPARGRGPGRRAAEVSRRVLITAGANGIGLVDGPVLRCPWRSRLGDGCRRKGAVRPAAGIRGTSPMRRARRRWSFSLPRSPGLGRP